MKSKYIIELTNICNLTCSLCPRNYIDMALGYMSIILWHRIIETVPEGSTILPFWRGESTLHPEFCEMIKELKDYDVVLATNGTNINPILEVMEYLNVINVSIHNQKSYEGYQKLSNYAIGSKTNIIASRIEGEPEFVKDSRIYKRHSMNGMWGKVTELNLDEIREGLCPRLYELVFSWDGRRGRCCYVWDTKTRMIDYPDAICLKCDQWMGNGKTL